MATSYITNATLAQQITDLANKWSVRELQMRTWLAGTAVGGDFGNGTYPLTNYLGAVYYVASPAAMASGVAGSSTAAAASAAAALVSQNAASTSATNALASQTAAGTSATNAAGSATTATTQAGTSANSAANSAISAANAVISATQAAASALTAHIIYMDSEPGDEGMPGTQGVQGFTGAQGPTVFGIAGLDGDMGDDGVPGIQGVTGAVGPTGFGMPGLDGDMGDDGVPGIQGVTGARGPIGLSIAGLDGDMGDDGVPGIQGATGAQGPIGLSIAGLDGDMGDDGVPGIQGFTGAQGPIGLSIAGLDGDTGDDGMMIQGNQGIQGLQGIQGFTGAQGPTVFGIAGLDGDTGDDGMMIPGNQGIQGPAGVAGAAGASNSDAAMLLHELGTDDVPYFGMPTNIGPTTINGTAIVNGNLGIGIIPDSSFHVLSGTAASLRVGYNSTPANYYDATTHNIRSITGVQLVTIAATGAALTVAGSSLFSGAVTTSASYQRNASGKGYIDGNYTTGIETGTTSGCIYSIGGTSYAPGTTTLGTMYGIGYCNSSATLITGVTVPASLWGMYAAANGVANIFLDTSGGRGYFSGVVVSGAKNCVTTSVATAGSAGGNITAQSGGTATGGSAGDMIFIY